MTQQPASFEFQPPLSDAPRDRGFLQTILERSRTDRRGGDTPLGRLTWHATCDQGTAQLLELHVEPSRRRGGCGTRLVRAMLEQIARLNARKIPGSRPIRVVWTVVAQKHHLSTRAFLTRMGFHHVATSKHLYLDDDAMVYAKALD